MRALVFRGPDRPLLLETVPDPTPGPGELVLKVGRCGICGSDLHLTEEAGWFPVGSILGHEFAGEVVAVGREAGNFRVGDLVTGLPMGGCGHCASCQRGYPIHCANPLESAYYAGGFADYVRVGARTSLKLPAALSMTDGALVEPIAGGLHGVALARMEPGSRVLVAGAGGIGLAIIYWARRLGAGRLAVLSRSRRREVLALEAGADVFVQAGEHETAEVEAALGGQPDIVFECIGVNGALAQAVRHVRCNGTVVSLGMCTKPDTLVPAEAARKQVSLRFSMAYTVDEVRTTIDMLDSGHIAPSSWVSDVISLEMVPAKIMAMRAGGMTEKIHVDPLLTPQDANSNPKHAHETTARPSRASP